MSILNKEMELYDNQVKMLLESKETFSAILQQVFRFAITLEQDSKNVFKKILIQKDASLFRMKTLLRKICNSGN